MGTGAATVAILGAAVLAGQLSVGWLNDLVDRERDRAAGRNDKPLALGLVTPGTLRVATGAAAAACVPLSLALGLRAGLAHLAAVAVAWAYNLRLKSTPWSWAPYAVAFALLPVVAWQVAPESALPPWWLVLAAALLGVGAHGANVLPDLSGDRATGVSGLPHRMPLPALRAGTAGVLLTALALLTLGPGGSPGSWEVAVLAAGTALSAAGSGVVGRMPARAPFVAVIGLAVLCTAMVLARGTTA